MFSLAMVFKEPRKIWDGFKALDDLKFVSVIKRSGGHTSISFTICCISPDTEHEAVTQDRGMLATAGPPKEKDLPTTEHCKGQGGPRILLAWIFLNFV